MPQQAAGVDASSAAIATSSSGDDSSKRAHLPALDGLRGIAILLVLSSHLIEGSSVRSPIGRALLAIPHSGWAGVDLFFVLSGFLITGILLGHKSAPGYFRNFYARRILRIFPLYYGVLIVVFGMLPYVAAFPQEGLRQLLPEQAWFWTYTSNIRSAVTGAEFNAPGIFLNHFWSLAIEEQFYIVWPAVIFFCSARAVPRVCIAIILGSLVARLWGAAAGLDIWRLTAGTPFHIDSLAIGALLAWKTRNDSGGLTALAPLGRWVAAGALCSLIAVYWVFGGLRQRPIEMCFTMSLLAVFFGAVLTLLVAEPSSALARLVSWSALRLFGRYSYGLYVFSSLLQPYLESIFATKVLAERVHSFAIAGLLHLLLEVSACLAVAMISYHLFEMRFLGLKKYFEYRPQRSRP